MRAATVPALALLAIGACDCGDPLADLEPDIDVSPTALDVGVVRTRFAHSPTVTIGNRGSGALSIISLEISPSDSPFVVGTAPTSVAPLGAEPITFALELASPGVVSGELVIASDDPDTPRLVVPLRGEGGVASLAVSPNPVTFGVVNEGQGAARTVTVTNDGLDDLIVNDIALVDDVGFIVDVSQVGGLPRRLVPNESALLALSLQPTAGLIVDGADLRDTLRVTTSVGETDVVVTATVNLAPTAIAFEQATRRDVVKAGVNEIVLIDGSETSDPEGDAFTFSWSVAERPPSSSAPVLGQGQPVVRFSPDVIGRYVVRLRATDVHGAFAEDDVEIIPRDLAVVLTWEPAFDAPCRAFTEAQCASFSAAERRQRCCGQSDLDLHLTAPGGSLGDYGTCPAGCPPEHCAEATDEHVDTCRQEGLDCGFANRRPEWGAAGRADDPSLDIDDVAGDGPEIITLNNPADGSYRVVVHYCQDRIGEASLATVSIFDQGVLLQQTSPQAIAEGQAWLAAILVRSASGWQVVAAPGVFETAPAGLCSR